ncbi:MAG: RcnB family protein, partial [Azonexus sp.]
NQFRSGHCPPGLAKKGNGCMPPGQAKKWRKGQPLPQGVAYYELPHDLVYRMPPPPPRHRYVRVGSDILLLSIGSGIVVDAMIDIGR